jgi:uncharacterized membrane protein YkvA (DUF1232 family)
MTLKKRGIRPWMFRKEMTLLYYALRDNRTPLRARLPAIFSLLYLLSPIDLIPDIVPFLGYLDDILIVPFLLNLSIRLLPADIKEECLAKAVRSQKKIKMAIFFLLVFIICWILAIFLVWKKLLGNS